MLTDINKAVKTLMALNFCFEASCLFALAHSFESCSLICLNSLAKYRNLDYIGLYFVHSVNIY